MENNRNNTEKDTNQQVTGYSGKGEGMQGVDKAPGEETSGGTDNFIREAQKGKNKVDGDPSKESDQPIKQK